MAKILEVGDFIYNDPKKPNQRYEVTACTAKMCTVYDKRTGTTAKAKREPNEYGAYALHGVYGYGFIVEADAYWYYSNFVKQENEKNRITKLQNKMFNIAWREIPAEKLDAIIKILETN